MPQNRGMKYAAIAFLAVLALPGFVFAADPADELNDIPKACAVDWPHDFVMQEHCVKRQTTAVQRLDVMAKEIQRKQDAQEQAAMVGCVEQWRNKRGGMDFVMVEHCLKRQIGALQRLRSSSSASR